MEQKALKITIAIVLCLAIHTVAFGSIFAVVDSFPSPASTSRGLAWDGTYLWHCDDGQNKLFQIDTSGNIVASFDWPYNEPYGLTYDDTNLWVCDNTNDYVYEVTTDGEILSSFPSPGNLYGVAWDGNNLWISSNQSLFKMTKSGDVLDEYQVGSIASVSDLAFDGVHLWIAHYYGGEIAKVSIGGEVLEIFDVGGNPIGITWDGNYLWYADDASSRIYQVLLGDADVDVDGIQDDGDDSGIPGDNPCSSGVTMNCDDNCLNTPNGPDLGTCFSWSGMARGTTCLSDQDCGGVYGSCSMNQEDADGDGWGDVCICTVTITPKSATVNVWDSLQFTVDQSGDCRNPCYSWEVIGDSGATINTNGSYVAGGSDGTDIVTVIDNCNDDVLDNATVNVMFLPPEVSSVTVTPDPTGEQPAGGLEIEVLFNKSMDTNYHPTVSYDPYGPTPPQFCTTNASWSTTNNENDTFIIYNDNPITEYTGEATAIITINDARSSEGIELPENSDYSFSINVGGITSYVDDNSVCILDCGSSENPWPTIQQAIDMAYGDDDTIIVDEGVYSGPINFQGKTITVMSIAGPEVTTIIGGALFNSGEETNTTLNGFTITGGIGFDLRECDDWSHVEVKIGGGICICQDSNPTIQNCIITNNAIEGPDGSSGGGIFVGIDSSSPTISHCIISNNSANSGGGIASYGSPNITNCTIVDNNGTGVFGFATIKNTILWNNDNDLEVITSDMISYSIIGDGDFKGINGNIPCDPLLVGDGDYHLTSNSPGIDAGDPLDDYSAEPDPSGSRINIGAYGNTFEAASSNLNCDSDFDEDGLNNCEEKDIYGTLFCWADSDYDGIDDGNEVNLWGEDWGNDPDNDTLINILDPDSDNDGYNDGEEINAGTDPSDPNPPFAYPKLISAIATPDPTGEQQIGELAIELLFNEEMDTNFIPSVNYNDPHGSGGLQSCSTNGSWSTTNYPNDTYVIHNDNPIVPFAIAEGISSINVSEGKNIIGGIMIPNSDNSFIIGMSINIYVDDDSSCTEGCGSPGNSWPTIQQAINQAYGDNDIILVDEGMYSGSINFQGKSITVRSMAGPEVTIIIGGVLFNSGEGLNATLNGFTITGGIGFDLGECDDWSLVEAKIGGGICICQNSNPTIQNCIITDNNLEAGDVNTGGGGIFVMESSPTIIHCIITNNSADYGGGIWAWGSPTITNCTITSNIADECGGLYISGSPIITNNNIFNNEGGGTCINIYPYEQYEGSGSSIGDYNMLSSYNNVQITYNNIYNNGDGSYEVDNQLTDDVNAANNWWGTTDTAMIEGKIFDHNDDSSKGEVFYLPITEEEHAICEGDFDCDSLIDFHDNCPNIPNTDQLDSYPPQGNNIGDACDCECDFTCDGDVDADDVTTFLEHFGREPFYRPCTSGDPCIGDFICDADVDADDVTVFLEDFGREQYYNPCPACVEGDWCVYE